MMTDGIIAMAIIAIARICQGLVLTYTGVNNAGKDV